MGEHTGARPPPLFTLKGGTHFLRQKRRKGKKGKEGNEKGKKIGIKSDYCHQ